MSKENPHYDVLAKKSAQEEIEILTEQFLKNGGRVKHYDVGETALFQTTGNKKYGKNTDKHKNN